VTDTFKALGAIPVITSGAEIYTALQTHLVDGGDVTLVSTETAKYYEVQKYMSITNHQLIGQTMLVNAQAWLRLPKPLRDIVERDFDAAVGMERTDVAKLDDTVKVTLEGKGLIFNNADIPSFRSVIRNAGLYTKWRDQFGGDAWALLERTVGKLT
jgi:TRAP-type C4-dicarboxylate transport system substrate-binding protein